MAGVFRHRAEHRARVNTTMRIELKTEPMTEVAADALVVGLWEGEPPSGDTADLNRALDNALSDVAGLAADAELTGRAGEHALLYTHGKIAARRLLVVGLGRRAE